MRILLSLLALCGVIAIADLGLSPGANATVLTNDVRALKTEQAGVADLARTTCWWRNGRRVCSSARRGPRCWWHRGRRVCRW